MVSTAEQRLGVAGIILRSMEFSVKKPEQRQCRVCLGICWRKTQTKVCCILQLCFFRWLGLFTLLYAGVQHARVKYPRADICRETLHVAVPSVHCMVNTIHGVRNSAHHFSPFEESNAKDELQS